ncbi:MAG: site-2 protease family protein [Chloroflexi bacterium]|nr:site-2 protease family protein [Chloroflexota bacterium]MCH8876099.1 site-2 protease family protein [Chloroflexota bacterium]
MLGLFGDSPAQFVYLVISMVVALTIHELAHGWTAFQLGDDTAQRAGRLTLNPLKHLDPLGSLMILFAGFGWAKPVPFDPYTVTRRTPAGVMLVAAAGPLSNLLMAIVASIPFQTGLLSSALASEGLLLYARPFLATFIYLNLILLFFNLLPVSPLDGEKVLTYFLPPSGQATMARLRPYGPMLLILLMVAGRGIFNVVIGTPVNQLFQLLVS